MKILLAEDDAVSRAILRKALESWKHEVIEVPDGEKALQALRMDEKLRLAIVDWMMPLMDGIEVVRKARELFTNTDRYVYMILLTQKDSRPDIVAGLEAGADDYMVKPFDPDELKVRIRSGQRIVELQSDLAATNARLLNALADVKKLSGFLPLCASCKRIRDADGNWHQLESYISKHSEAHFSHSVCPDCAKQLYPDLFEDI
jgi:DNA-binding response OmpR family regulator